MPNARRLSPDEPSPTDGAPKKKTCCEAVPRDPSKLFDSHVTDLFERHDVSDGMQDATFVHAVDITGDGPPDLVTCDGRTGRLAWYRNPYDPLESADDAPGGRWEVNRIATVAQPAEIYHARIATTAHNDVVVLSDAREQSDGAKLWWFRNPLSKQDGTLNDPWTCHCIASGLDLAGIAVGHFTRADKVQILGVLARNATPDTGHDAPTVMFSAPDDVTGDAEWPRETLDDIPAHVLSGSVVMHGPPGAKDGLNALLVASDEGVSYVFWDGTWNVKPAVHLPVPTHEDEKQGCAIVDVGSYNGDSCAFILTGGRFPRDALTLCTKASGPRNTVVGCEWTVRHFSLDAHMGAISGSGRATHVVTGDFTGDGNDEIVVTTRDGAFLCQVKDLNTGNVSMRRVSSAATARCAIADFNSDGRLDLATVSVAHGGKVGLTEQRYISVLYNTFSAQMPSVPDGCISLSHVVGSEMLVSIRSGTEVMRKWLFDVHRFKHYVVYMPKRSVVHGYKPGSLFKVICGQVAIQPMPNVDPIVVTNCAASLSTRDLTVRSQDSVIRADESTVAWVIEPDFDAATEDVPVVTDEESVNKSIKLPEVPGLRGMQFEMVTDPAGNPMHFFSLSGFTLRLDGCKLSHHTFWLADRGTDCGLHDHGGQGHREAFCEVHTCVVNGTGAGGMFRSVRPMGTPLHEIARADLERLVVPSGFEHGPMWSWDERGRPARRADGSIKYRAHTWISGRGDSRSELRSMDFWIAHKLVPEIVCNSMKSA